MTTLAVASPAFVDLTFVGVDALPGPGQERYATELLRSPGGGAITAIAAARLGLATTLACPLGTDDGGAFVAEALAAEGVATVAPHPGRTATTVIVPLDGDRAMLTHDPRVVARAADLRELAPRAAVCGFGDLDALPASTLAYVTCGEDGARAFAGRLPGALAGARALLVNEAEARILTGAPSGEAAAAALTRHVPTVVVTLGARGALQLRDGEAVHADAVAAAPVVDTTGAGDVFAATYVWADLAGAGPGERLRWASLAAGLSVTVATGAAGAVGEDRLIDEGARRGLRDLRVPAGGGAPASRAKER